MKLRKSAKKQNAPHPNNPRDVTFEAGLSWPYLISKLLEWIQEKGVTKVMVLLTTSWEGCCCNQHHHLVAYYRDVLIRIDTTPVDWSAALSGHVNERHQLGPLTLVIPGEIDETHVEILLNYLKLPCMFPYSGHCIQEEKGISKLSAVFMLF